MILQTLKTLAEKNNQIVAIKKRWTTDFRNPQFGHPILMWILLGVTLYSLYSGIQIRRTRSVDTEVRKELIKKKFNRKI